MSGQQAGAAAGGGAANPAAEFKISVPAPPDAKGGVSVEQGAGKTESLLLLAGQAKAVARRVADAVAAAALDGTPVVVIAGDPSFDFGLADQFELARRQVAQQLRTAIAAAPEERVSATELAPLATAGAALGQLLSAGATAAQYVAETRTLKGIELTGNDAMLVVAVAGALRALKAPPTVRIAPLDGKAAREAVFKMLDELGGLADAAARAGARATSTAARLAAEAERLKPTDPGGATQRTAEAAAMTGAAARCDAALKAVDALGVRLSAKADAGGLPAGDLIEQIALRDAIDGGAAALFIKVQAASGTMQTKHGLFVGLAGEGAPIKVGALLVASHVLITGTERDVLSAELYNYWSDYKEVSGLWALDDAPEANSFYNQGRR